MLHTYLTKNRWSNRTRTKLNERFVDSYFFSFLLLSKIYCYLHRKINRYDNNIFSATRSSPMQTMYGLCFIERRALDDDKNDIRWWIVPYSLSQLSLATLNSFNYCCTACTAGDSKWSFQFLLINNQLSNVFFLVRIWTFLMAIKFQKITAGKLYLHLGLKKASAQFKQKSWQ